VGRAWVRTLPACSSAKDGPLPQSWHAGSVRTQGRARLLYICRNDEPDHIIKLAPDKFSGSSPPRKAAISSCLRGGASEEMVDHVGYAGTA